MRALIFGVLGLMLMIGHTVSAQEIRPPGTGAAVEGTVGNDIFQLRYLGDSKIKEAPSDLDYGVLFTEDRDIVVSAALMFNSTKIPIPRLQFALGPQVYLASLQALHKTDVFAIAIGASVRYELIPQIGFALFGTAFYSPGALTFGSAHNLYDFTGGGDIKIAHRVSLLGGYRWLKFTLVNEPDRKLGNEVFIGVRWELK